MRVQVNQLIHRDGSFKALKILSAESYGGKHDIREREILLHLRDADTGHPGYRHICTLIDRFEHNGPNGRHVCLVFHVMSDTLLGYRQMLPGEQLHDATAQRVAVQLLLALDYAHTFGVIHTDLKPTNVFVQLEDESLISRSYLPATPADPTAFDPKTKP
jgi:serine/threonine-protein kinase SRPK3